MLFCEFIPGSRERLFAHPAKGAWVDSILNNEISCISLSVSESGSPECN